MDYEEKLSDYIDSIINDPRYKSDARDWAFGAIDFAFSVGLIGLDIRNMLQEKYQLIN